MTGVSCFSVSCLFQNGRTTDILCSNACMIFPTHVAILGQETLIHATIIIGMKQQVAWGTSMQDTDRIIIMTFTNGYENLSEQLL